MKWFNFLFTFLLLASCQKESISLEVLEIESNTSDAIHDIFFVNENIAYYCGGELWRSGVIGKSIDGGQTWEVVLEADNILFALAFKNELEGVAVGFSGRVWQTSDGGDSWSLTESAPNYPTFSDAQFVSDNQIILSAGFNYYSGGFARYYFGSQSFRDSLINQDMQAVHFFNSLDGVLAGYGAVFTTSNTGDLWTPRSIKGDYFKDIDFNDAGEGLLIGYQGKIFESTDKGLNWERNAKKASFFTTKGNLESTAITGNKAFIVGQNSAMFYTDNFLAEDWVSVETPFGEDFLKVCIVSPTMGFVSGGNGTLFSFSY